MSSYVNMIIARHGPQQQEHIIWDIKKYTSIKIIEAINNNGQESRRERSCLRKKKHLRQQCLMRKAYTTRNRVNVVYKERTEII